MPQVLCNSSPMIGIAAKLVIFVALLLAQPSIADEIPGFDRDLHVEFLDVQHFKYTAFNSTAIKIWPNMADTVPEKYLNDVSVNVTYSILSSDLFTYDAFCKNGIAPRPENISYEEDCKSSLIGFGNSDDFNTEELVHYCYKRSVKFYHLSKKDELFVVGLLPGLPYDLVLNASYEPTSGGKQYMTARTSNVTLCLPQAQEPPSYPPIADPSSFIIMKKDRATSSNTSVHLFWRPVSIILMRFNDSYQVVTCNDSRQVKVFEKRIDNLRQGRESLEKPSNELWQCHIRAGNKYGESKQSRAIIIPKEDDLLDLRDSFKFFVAKTAGDEYILRWPRVEDVVVKDRLLSQRIASRAGGLDLNGTYTLYWCSKKRAIDCHFADGMMRTTLASAGVGLLYLHDDSERNFGVAFTSSRSQFSTGIIWQTTKCVFAVKSVDLPRGDMIRINREAEDPSTVSFSVSWSYNVCESIVALIESYEIEYCSRDYQDGCFSRLFLVDQYLLMETQDDYKNCNSLVKLNDLTNQAKLYNLSPSTKYMVKIRYQLANETLGSWSEPIFVRTFTAPEHVHACRIRLFLIIVIFCIVLVITASILTLRTRVIIKHNQLTKDHYLDLDGGAGITRLIKKLPKDDDLCARSLRFCNDRPKRELEQNQTSTKSDLDERESSSDDPAFDYVPRHLMFPSTDQTSNDRPSENSLDEEEAVYPDPDDLSITSQSSFLDGILGIKGHDVKLAEHIEETSC